MDIRQLIIFVLLVLMIVFNVLLGLFVLARALTTLVRDLSSVKGQTPANGVDRVANVEFEMRRKLGRGKKLHSSLPLASLRDRGKSPQA